MEKYLQAQFVTIPHGFTLGFRSDTSKPFSVLYVLVTAACQTCGSGTWLMCIGVFLLSCTRFGTVPNEFCHALCLWSWGEAGKLQAEASLWGLHCPCYASTYSAIPCHYETPLPVALTRIPFGLWHFVSRVQCVLILWVLPFLLLAASRRHSRSTSALSTADSVGQSGEQALTAWIRFLYVVLFYTILTFAIVCISQHLACASHRCGAFCSGFVQCGFSF